MKLLRELKQLFITYCRYIYLYYEERIFFNLKNYITIQIKEDLKKQNFKQCD